MQQSPRKFWEVWGRSDALYNRWAAAHGVNNYRLFVLYVLDNHPGATQKAIADHAGLPKQTVNTVVRALRDEGYVTLVNAEKKNGVLTETAPYGISGEFMERFSPQYATIQDFVSKRIGRFTKTVSTRPAYFGSSAFIDLIHTLQLDISGADISLAAPLSYDTQIKEGDIYVYDMFNLYKYENMLYTMKLSGKEVHDALEMSYDLWTNRMTSPDDHILLLRDQPREGAADRAAFKNFSFNFDSAAGIIYTVDVTKPCGSKVTILSMADGTPFHMDKMYTVALNSYRGNGGGELLTKGAGISQDELKERIISSTDKDLRYYLMQYIEQKKVIEPRALGQWKFIPEEWAVPASKRDYEFLFGTNRN